MGFPEAANAHFSLSPALQTRSRGAAPAAQADRTAQDTATVIALLILISP